MKEAVNLVKEIIYEMNNICLQNNIKLIIINLPIKIQFDGSLDDYKFNQSKISNILLEISKDKNITMIDLFPIFNSTKNPLEYYIDEDYHLNSEGHKLLAEEILLRF